MKKTVVLFFMAIGFLTQAANAQIKQQINAISTLEVTDRIWVTVVPSDRNELERTGELADKVQAVF